MPFRSRTAKQSHTGKHYHKPPSTLYGAPTTKKYSDIMSEIHTEQDARLASKEMLGEFTSAEQRDKKRRVKAALVQAANRAEVAGRNPNFGPEERTKWRKIEQIYRKDIDRMELPPQTYIVQASENPGIAVIPALASGLIKTSTASKPVVAVAKGKALTTTKPTTALTFSTKTSSIKTMPKVTSKPTPKLAPKASPKKK
jgi:hypothetical protein